MYVETKKFNALLASGTYAMQVNRDQGYGQGVALRMQAYGWDVGMWQCGKLWGCGKFGNWKMGCDGLDSDGPGGMGRGEVR